jgi:hypothetical protein
MIACPLPLPRHEAFAQGVAAGLSASKAYAQAYGRKRDATTRACGARLLANVNIQRRIAEIRDATADEAEVCLSKLIPMLESRAQAEIRAGHLGSALNVLKRLKGIAARHQGDPLATEH